jgi:hypothetical protein
MSHEQAWDFAGMNHSDEDEEGGERDLRVHDQAIGSLFLVPSRHLSVFSSAHWQTCHLLS